MEYGISLGSNVGDRETHLREARSRLETILGGVRLECSALYESEPIDVAVQHRHLPFLNAVAIFESDLEPQRILEICQNVENRGGRRRGAEVNTPRAIDLDIIYAGEQVVDDRNLTIPHPRWAQRRFVLVPLSELRPDLVLPQVSNPVSKLLDALKENGRVSIFKRKW